MTHSRRLADLPGPSRLPLLGNALQIDLPRLHIQLEDWSREHGPHYRCDLGPRPGVVTRDPDWIRQALRERPRSFRRIRRFEEIFGELGVHGVFSAEGEEWRHARRIVNFALDPRHLVRFFPTLRRVTRSLHTRWTAAAREGRVVDIRDDLMRFAVDVVTSLVFSVPVDSLGGSAAPMVDDVARVFPLLARRTNAALPLWRWLPSREDREAVAGLERLRAWMGETIASARARMAAEPHRSDAPETLLEAMLAARDDDGRELADAIVFGNGLQLLGAGEDTTANTAAWAVHLLLDAPAEVEHLRDALDGVLGDAGVPADPDALDELRFVDAIANEAMRMKSTSPAIFLESSEAVRLGDTELPAGTVLILLTRAPGLELDDRFAPGRFADPARVKELQRSGVFVPFGSGPRMCPGRQLALLEIRMALATLFGGFDVVRDGRSEDVHERFGFTMVPEGLAVRLRRRTVEASRGASGR